MHWKKSMSLRSSYNSWGNYRQNIYSQSDCVSSYLHSWFQGQESLNPRKKKSKVVKWNDFSFLLLYDKCRTKSCWNHTFSNSKSSVFLYKKKKTPDHLPSLFVNVKWLFNSLYNSNDVRCPYFVYPLHINSYKHIQTINKYIHTIYLIYRIHTSIRR